MKVLPRRLGRVAALFWLMGAGCLPGSEGSRPASIPARAATVAQPAVALPPGVVQVFFALGAVTLTNDAGQATALRRGQTLAEGATLETGANGNALVVFSNGATLKISPKTKLKVVHFQQAPFDEKVEGTFLRLRKDPSQSIVELELQNGTVSGEVKLLDKAAGSTFTITTTGGAVEVRGGMFSISVARNEAGQLTHLEAACYAGAQVWTPTDPKWFAGRRMMIPAGAWAQMEYSAAPVTGRSPPPNVTRTRMSKVLSAGIISSIQDAINLARAGSISLQPMIAPPEPAMPYWVKATSDEQDTSLPTIVEVPPPQPPTQ